MWLKIAVKPHTHDGPSFDGPPHYKVTYRFDCSSYFGGSGNFILSPVDANGNPVAGPLVNRLAAKGDGMADGYNFGTQKNTCSRDADKRLPPQYDATPGAPPQPAED